MSGKNILKISELMEAGEAKLQTGPFGTQLKASEYVSEGVPVINVRNIGYGNIKDAKLEYLDEKMASKLAVHKLRSGDIVFGRKGAADRHVYIRKEQSGWIQGSDCLRLRIDSQRVFPRYLSYYFDTKPHKDWMEALCSFGATMSSLNQGIVKRISFPAHPYLVQQKIAAILSAYDDLIENNQRRIALLEKAAEEIYREWFVRLRFPGWEGAKFVKGVPDGWDVKPVSAVVKINPRDKVEPRTPMPYASMGDLSLTSMFFSFSETRTDGSGTKFRNNDVLFPRITPSVENGKRGFVMNLAEEQVGLGSTEFIVMREKILSAEYIYFLTCLPELRKHAELSMTGASGRQRVQEDCFDYFLVKVPDKNTLSKFASLIRPFFQQIKSLCKANQELKKSRDQLLARLISGKLPVEGLDIRFPPGMAAEQEAAHA